MMLHVLLRFRFAQNTSLDLTLQISCLCVCMLETKSIYVALVILELMQATLALNSQRSSCFYLLNIRVIGVCHQGQFVEFLGKNIFNWPLLKRKIRVLYTQVYFVVFYLSIFPSNQYLSEIMDVFFPFKFLCIY